MINIRPRKLLASVIAASLVFGLFRIVPAKAEEKILYGAQKSKPANNTYTVTVKAGQSVQDAIDDAKSGTTIIIKGSHRELLTIKKNGITLRGDNGSMDLTRPSGMTDSTDPVKSYGDIISITGSDVVIENLEITGLYLRAPSSSRSAGGIRINPGSDNVHILNCDIHDLGCEYNFDFESNPKDKDRFNGHGISIKGSEEKKTSNIVISGNRVHNLRTGRSESVVLNNNTQYFTVSDNSIFDNDNIGIDLAGGYKFEADGSSNAEHYRTFDWSRNGEVCGNYVSRCSSKIFSNPGYWNSKGEPGGGADGIYVDGGRDIWIHDNFVTGSDIGLEIASEIRGWTAEGIIAENNQLIYNDQYVGFALGGSSTSNGVAKDNIIRYNTIISRGEQYCMVVKVSENNEISHNILIADDTLHNTSTTTYFSENAIRDNAVSGKIKSSVESCFENTLKFTVKSIDVDNASLKVEIKADKDLKGYGYHGKSGAAPTVTKKPTITKAPTATKSPTVTKAPSATVKPKPTVPPPTSVPVYPKPLEPTVTDKPIPTVSLTGATATPAPDISYITSAPEPDDQIREFIDRIYKYVLDRESEEEGAKFWCDELYSFRRTGAEVGLQFIFSDEFKARGLSDDDYVTVLYRTFFGREPEADGFKFWTSALSDGSLDRKSVADGFVFSQEWADTCASYGIRSGGTIKPAVEIAPTDETYDFVERMYTTALKRASDMEGRNFWARELANFRYTGEKVGVDFFLSDEMDHLYLDDKEYVTRLYKTFMDRDPEQDGFEFWIEYLRSEGSRRGAVLGFTRSAEFIDKCIEARILPY